MHAGNARRFAREGDCVGGKREDVGDDDPFGAIGHFNLVAVVVRDGARKGARCR